MASSVEKIRSLLALADQDNEEGRTAAHTAIKLIKKHGFVLTVSTAEEETPKPAPSPAWARPAERPRPPPPPPPPPPASKAATRWNEVKKNFAGIVVDEVSQFMKTIDVLPRDIPVYGVQLVPAKQRGTCSCGNIYQRGEMVSREKRPVCATCVSERAQMRRGGGGFR